MNKLFSADQIRSWDQYTILHEPISSIELMERASVACFDWIANKYTHDQHFSLLCGYGNNGGDGLAIARMLVQTGFQVTVYLLSQDKRSKDNQINLNRLRDSNFAQILPLSTGIIFDEGSVIIDALFGTGLNRSLDNSFDELIKNINNQAHEVISIDLPSGMMADNFIPETVIVEATYTLSFEQYKKAFLFEETGKHAGEIILLPIGLSTNFTMNTPTLNYLIEKNLIKANYKRRKPFTHKGSYGHSLLIAGSLGKMGACVLAAKACLRSGTGLLTCLVPASENQIIQMSVPEAMTLTRTLNHDLDTSMYHSVGIGPGLGTSEESFELLKKLLAQITFPMVVDADAINLISSHKELLTQLPTKSVITPHPKEFDRLFGAHANSYDRHEAQKIYAKKYQLFILLKGTHSCLATPDGECYFNLSGNAGMAKGGSGDVLTGIIIAFYAQYRNMKTACLMSMYLHGLSADIATKKIAQESLLASDIVDHISAAILQVADAYE